MIVPSYKVKKGPSLMSQKKALRCWLTVWNKCVYMSGLWSFLKGKVFIETADRNHHSLITAMVPYTWGSLSFMNNLLCSYHISDKSKLRHGPWGKTLRVGVQIAEKQWWTCSWEVGPTISSNTALIRLISSCIDVCWRNQAELVCCST